jgi:hypothetical protein
VKRELLHWLAQDVDEIYLMDPIAADSYRGLASWEFAG